MESRTRSPLGSGEAGSVRSLAGLAPSHPGGEFCSQILIVLIGKAVLQSVSAVWAGRCLAGSLVFLDGLVELYNWQSRDMSSCRRPTLRKGREVKARCQQQSGILAVLSVSSLPVPACSLHMASDSEHHLNALALQFEKEHNYAMPTPQMSPNMSGNNHTCGAAGPACRTSPGRSGPSCRTTALHILRAPASFTLDSKMQRCHLFLL